MENQTFTPVDVVNLAIAKDAVKISAALDQMLGQRVYDAVQARRQEVATQLFAEPVEASAEEQEEQPTEASAEEQAEDEGNEVADTEQQPESEESNETA